MSHPWTVKRLAAELKEQGERRARERMRLMSAPRGGRQLEPARELPKGITAEPLF